MAAGASALLAPWSSFFVMTGSSAASLTGLMFVVITLVTRTTPASRSRDGLATFSTPTVMHFCAALFVSAILCAPWRTVVYPEALIAIAGLGGIVYVVRIVIWTRRLTIYVADLEDWTFYISLPLLAYGATFGGAIALATAPELALFALAGGVLLLLFLGIRNAWDVVTYLAISGGGPAQ